MLDLEILMYQKTTPTNIMHRAFSLVCHMIAFTYDAGLKLEDNLNKHIWLMTNQFK